MGSIHTLSDEFAEHTFVLDYSMMLFELINSAIKEKSCHVVLAYTNTHRHKTETKTAPKT